MRLTAKEVLDSVALGGDPVIVADVPWYEPGMGMGTLSISATYKKPIAALSDGRKFCVICKRFGTLCPHYE